MPWWFQVLCVQFDIKILFVVELHDKCSLNLEQSFFVILEKKSVSFTVETLKCIN